MKKIIFVLTITLLVFVSNFGAGKAQAGQPIQLVCWNTLSKWTPYFTSDPEGYGVVLRSIEGPGIHLYMRKLYPENPAGVADYLFSSRCVTEVIVNNCRNFTLIGNHVVNGVLGTMVTCD